MRIAVRRVHGIQHKPIAGVHWSPSPCAPKWPGVVPESAIHFPWTPRSKRPGSRCSNNVRAASREARAGGIVIGAAADVDIHPGFNGNGYREGALHPSASCVFACPPRWNSLIPRPPIGRADCCPRDRGMLCRSAAEKWLVLRAPAKPSAAARVVGTWVESGVLRGERE